MKHNPTLEQMTAIKLFGDGCSLEDIQLYIEADNIARRITLPNFPVPIVIRARPVQNRGAAAEFVCTGKTLHPESKELVNVQSMFTISERDFRDGGEDLVNRLAFRYSLDLLRLALSLAYRFDGKRIFGDTGNHLPKD